MQYAFGIKRDRMARVQVQLWTAVVWADDACFLLTTHRRYCGGGQVICIILELPPNGESISRGGAKLLKTTMSGTHRDHGIFHCTNS